MKKRIAAVFVLVLGLSIAVIYALGTFPPKQASEVHSFRYECRVGGEVTIYTITSYQKATGISCNSANIQKASVSFEDGSQIEFYLEFNGQFVSWRTTMDFSCKADWTSNHIAIEGTVAIPGNPQTATISCGNDNVQVMMMGINPTITATPQPQRLPINQVITKETDSVGLPFSYPSSTRSNSFFRRQPFPSLGYETSPCFS